MQNILAVRGAGRREGLGGDGKNVGVVSKEKEEGYRTIHM